MGAGVAPTPVWSVNRERFRLNRGGNRQTNAALHRIAITQTRMHPAAQTCINRRLETGDSKPEALRALKRNSPTQFAERCKQPPNNPPYNRPLDIETPIRHEEGARQEEALALSSLRLVAIVFLLALTCCLFVCLLAFALMALVSFLAFPLIALGPLSISLHAGLQCRMRRHEAIPSTTTLILNATRPSRRNRRHYAPPQDCAKQRATLATIGQVKAKCRLP